MSANPVNWFEVYVDDMERARKFYATVLDTKLDRLEVDGIEMWAFPMTTDGAGAAGALVKMDGFPAGGNSTLVYFNSNDCDVEAGRVVAAGGRIHRGKESIGEYGFVALAFDTEGNMFGIHSTQ